jgi:hypothetical protein
MLCEAEVLLAHGKSTAEVCKKLGIVERTYYLWLLRHGLASKDNVLTLLIQLRQVDMERASWKAPENSTQENFILGWKE